jgi:hypothetical protein
VFFDIIKNDNNANLTAEHQRFKQLISECKTAQDELDEKIDDIGVKTNKFGDYKFTDYTFNSEYVYTVIRNWVVNEQFRTSAQVKTLDLLFPKGGDVSTSLTNLNKVSMILFPALPNRSIQSNYMTGLDAKRSFEFYTDTSVTDADSNEWRSISRLLLRADDKQVDKYKSVERSWSGDIPHELLDLIEDWFDDLYDIFLNNTLESIHKKLVHLSSTLSVDREKLSQFKKNLFTKINKRLSNIVPVKDKIEQVIEIIEEQLVKMNGLLEGLSKTGTRVQINKLQWAPSDLGIEIQQGDYYFETNYADLLTSIECPRLTSKRTTGSVCIQPAGSISDLETNTGPPLFDHITTIFMILNTGQKNILPILDYFIYFTDLGIDVGLNAIGATFSINVHNASPLNNTAIVKTLQHFEAEGLVGELTVGGSKTSHMQVEFFSNPATRQLPPINTFINRFRIERNRLRKQMSGASGLSKDR